MKKLTSWGAMLMICIGSIILLPIFMNELGRVWGILTIVTFLGCNWFLLELHERSWNKRIKNSTKVEGEKE